MAFGSVGEVARLATVLSLKDGLTPGLGKSLGAVKKFDPGVGRASKGVGKLGKAVALRGTGDLDGAAGLYDAIIKADKNNRIAYFNASTLQEKYVKDFTKAAKYLEDYKDGHAGQLSPTTLPGCLVPVLTGRTYQPALA